MSTIAKRVAAGAAVLDEREPDWWRAERGIRIDELSIEASCACILGQLFGRYIDGLDALDLRSADRRALGFMWIEHRDYDVADADIDALTAEWKRVITERRAAS